MSLLRIAALAAFLSFTPSLKAQIQVFGGPDPDRRGSSVFLFSDAMTVGAAISYSGPVWKDDYNQMLDKLRDKNLRLGKNWWTSLDTSIAMEIGGKRLEAGAYFLGLHCDKDGNFHLMVFGASEAMKQGLMPFAADDWKGGVMIPLALHKDSLKEPAKTMVLAIEVDKQNPSNGTFSMHWGPHGLDAAVKFVLPEAKKEAKKEAKQEAKKG